MIDLSPKNARKVFHIRTGTIDLRGTRKYKYGDNTACRLCHTDNETVEHVTNICPNIRRSQIITNIYTTDCAELEEMAKRCYEFDNAIDALNVGAESETV